MTACECHITSRLDPDGDPIGQEIVHCPRHAEAHVAALEAEVERVREALKTYGQHTEAICGTTTMLANGTPFYEGCECGFDAALTPRP